MNKQVAKKIDKVKGKIENLAYEVQDLISKVEDNRNFNKDVGGKGSHKTNLEYLQVARDDLARACEDLSNAFNELSKIDLEDKEI